MRTEHKSSGHSNSTGKIPRFGKLKIVEIWKRQDGTFFCISTRHKRTGKWKDHFFYRWEFAQIPGFIEDHEDDHDIYCCIHGYTEEIKDKQYAVPSKVLWADCDEADPMNFPPELEPTIAFQTSPGRYSALWVMDDYVTEELNQRLTYQIGADKTGWAYTKVIRVIPGLRNYKYDDAPKVRYLWRNGPEHRVKRFNRLLKKLDKATIEGGKPERKFWTGTQQALTRLAASFSLNAKMRAKPSNDDLSGIWYSLGAEAIEKRATVAEAVAIASGSAAFDIRLGDKPRRAKVEIDRLWDKYAAYQAKLKREGKL